MAFRRCLSTRASIFARRSSPSVSYVPHHNDNDNTNSNSLNDPSHHRISHGLLARRLFGSNASRSVGLGCLSRDRREMPFSLVGSVGLGFCRHMSTTVGEGSDNIEYISDVAEILTDKTVEVVSSQAAVVNEVAIAAADSWPNVAFLQYVIDFIHSTTGFNWWISIALTTLLIRSLTIPFLIDQIKATTKLSALRPRVEAIKEEMDSKGTAEAYQDGQKRMKALFAEQGVTPFTPMKGLLIQGPVFVSFFLAIQNMAEKVPSFTTGGAYWFLDLSTPDSLYILPVLTAATFLINVECNVQEGMEGNPVVGPMKKFSRVIAVLTVPFTMSFPKAIFCYWVTSNLFSLVYGLVIKRPEVKRALNIPEITVMPSQSKPAFSFSEALKRFALNKQLPLSSAQLPKEEDRKVSPSSAISRRLQNLEKQAKEKRKNKKR